jgi:hypothetical protein
MDVMVVMMVVMRWDRVGVSVRMILSCSGRCRRRRFRRPGQVGSGGKCACISRQQWVPPDRYNSQGWTRTHHGIDPLPIQDRSWASVPVLEGSTPVPPPKQPSSHRRYWPEEGWG